VKGRDVKGLYCRREPLLCTLGSYKYFKYLVGRLGGKRAVVVVM